MARIAIPTVFQRHTEREREVEVEAATVSQALRELVQRHQALRPVLFDEGGKLQRFLTVFKGEEDIRYLDNLETALIPDDRLVIIPALAGG